MERPTTSLETLLRQHKELLIGRWITDMANTSAFIFSEIEGLNWAGFYLAEDGMLVLGPFQGKPACTTIALGRGVCGTAASERRVLVVPDVHEFPGHIACDAASRSELVVPLVDAGGRLLGVLDVDSPRKDRFGGAEKEFFPKIAAQLLAARR